MKKFVCIIGPTVGIVSIIGLPPKIGMPMFGIVPNIGNYLVGYELFCLSHIKLSIIDNFMLERQNNS